MLVLGTFLKKLHGLDAHPVQNWKVPVAMSSLLQALVWRVNPKRLWHIGKRQHRILRLEIEQQGLPNGARRDN